MLKTGDISKIFIKILFFLREEERKAGKKYLPIKIFSFRRF